MSKEACYSNELLRALEKERERESERARRIDGWIDAVLAHSVRLLEAQWLQRRARRTHSLFTTHSLRLPAVNEY